MWQPLVKANYEAEMGAHPSLQQITTRPRNTVHSVEANLALVSTYYLSPGIHLNIGNRHVCHVHAPTEAVTCKSSRDESFEEKNNLT